MILREQGSIQSQQAGQECKIKMKLILNRLCSVFSLFLRNHILETTKLERKYYAIMEIWEAIKPRENSAKRGKKGEKFCKLPYPNAEKDREPYKLNKQRNSTKSHFSLIKP